MFRSSNGKAKSDGETNINVAAIGPKSVTALPNGYTLFCANGNSWATDFGPYYPLYLIYDSQTEDPHYQAVYFLGKVGQFKSVKLIKENQIEIITVLHTDSNGAYTEGEGHFRKITIDVSNISEVIQNMPKKEGDLDAIVKVSVFSEKSNK